MRRYLYLFTGLVFSFVLHGQPADFTTHRIPGRLIVRHKSDPATPAAAQALGRHGARVRRRLGSLGISVVEVPETEIDAVMQSLRADPQFESVEYDYYAQPAAVPNDPSFVSQWHLAKIQASSAWNITTGNSTPVAVIDTGVDSTHPDLAGRILPGWNFVSNTSNTADASGHGTAVAGTIAAVANNALGVSGGTWQNPILPLVVVDANNYASYSNIAAAIQYAVDHGARVINASLGGTAASTALQSAVDYAWNHNAIVIAAALNNSSSTPVYPAACTHAVAVSATDENDLLAGFSDFGSWITVAAPGNNILTTMKGGGYGYWWGTSLATPVVSSVAALAVAAYPAMTSATLLSLLESNSDDLGPAGRDSSFGYGRVNAYRTVTAAYALGGTAPAPPPAPTPTPTPTPVPTTSAPIRINAGDSSYVDASGNTWQADTTFSGGNTWKVTNAIANTSAPALYQSCRYGDFSYVEAVPNGTYTVNLKFAEISMTGPGKRVFNVNINGASVLTNFDIFAQAGGAFIALDKSFPVSVTGGQISIQFGLGSANAPLVSAIEILQSGTATSPSPTPSVAAVRVNAGAGAYTDPSTHTWSADTGYSGGNTWSTAAAIANTTTPTLYQTCRYGVFTYSFAVPNGNYIVNLKFAEVSMTGPGQRVFNVAINGAAVLTNFDVFAQAGGALRALDKSFPVSVTGGQIAIQFNLGSANAPLVNGIEIVTAP